MGFKVVIVGGGLSGLGLAHCLSKAGIDYVVLERAENIFSDAGASMALWPHNVRLLDQLGLLDGANKLDCHVMNKVNVREDGSVLQKSNMLEAVGTALGHPWMCFVRQQLHELLINALPDYEKRILGGKSLDNIETTASGVKVTCKDGSVYEGSIVVGADGVNSMVRKDLAKRLGKDKLANPFTTTYRALFGRSNWTKDITPGTLYETHGDKFSVQVIPGGGTMMYLVYQRLPTPTQESVRCTDEEKEAFAKEVSHIHVAENVTFGDMWKESTWSYACGLEEGLADTWYGDRTVLVGDTVHKMTPNMGLGLNNGWQSAAVLTNGLYHLLQKESEPSTESLNKVFKEYQAQRYKMASDMSSVSGLYTRVVAWNNPVWKFADQYVTKYIGGDPALVNLLAVPLVKKGYTLDFVNEENFRTGNTAWLRGKTTVTMDQPKSEAPKSTPVATSTSVEVTA